MPSYTSRDEVAGEFKDIRFAADTSVTIDEVDTFITAAEAEVNSYLRNRYETPISSSTSPGAHAIAKMLATWLVADRVSRILKVKTRSEKTDQDGNRASLRKMAMKELEAYQSGEKILPDAEDVDVYLGVRGYTDDNSIKTEIDVETDEW